MVELDCMMYLITINLKLIKLYLNNINKVKLSYLLGILLVLWYVEFVCLFVALRPMSTAMVIAGRSVHLTTLFPGQA